MVLVMRVLAFVAGGVAILLLAYLVLLLVFRSGVVRDRYATLADARADSLFDRGWLPEILPSSAHDIEINNNLDLNESWGAFRFAPADWSEMAIRLSSPTEASRAFAGEIADRLSDGDVVREYANEGSVWVFLCGVREGRCDYSMVSRRKRD